MTKEEIGEDMNRAGSKDIEQLHKADSSLEKQLSSLSLIRLAIFILITFLFVSAILRRDSDAISAIVSKLQASVNQAEINKLHLDPISVYLSDYLPINDPGDIKYDSKAMDELRSQYQQVFNVKFSVLGTDLSFDLRFIIITFPLWLSIAQIYISIVREKRRVIRYIGMRVAAPDRTYASTWDALMFGPEEGAFRSYPGKLVNACFWVVVVAIVVMMLWLTKMQTAQDAVVFLRLGVIVVLCSAFYSAAFSSWVSTRLREQVKAQFEYDVPLDKFGRFWADAHCELLTLPKRVRPRLTLLIAGSLTICTLALQTAQVGCEDDRKDMHRTSVLPDQEGKPRPGYQIFTGAADWPPSLFAPLGFKITPTEDRYGMYLYGASLLLALVGIVVALFLLRPEMSKFLLCLSYGSVVVSVAFLCEYANPGLLLVGPFWVIPGIVTVLVYTTAILLRRRSPVWKDRLFRSMRMGYVPLLLADLAYMVSVGRILPGLIVLFLSTHLLTLGYFAAGAQAYKPRGNMLVPETADSPNLPAESLGAVEAIHKTGFR